MHDPGRDVHDRPFSHRLIDAVQPHETFAFQHVVNLGGDLVVVLLGAIDVDGVDPGRDIRVLAADQQMPPAAGAALLRGLAFMTD